MTPTQPAPVPARPVTIRDVARRAGVSLTTVSQVLNGRAGSASAATSRRVVDAARDLNYRPSAIARGLVLARTATLGVVIPTIVHPFFHRLVGGIEAVGREANYSVVLACAENPERERSAFETLSDQRVDGVIFMGNTRTAPSTHIAWVVAQGIPVVVVNREAPDVAVHRLDWDDIEVGRLATAHLIALGHRRIAHVAGTLGPPGQQSAHRRLAGYRAALAAADLPHDDRLIVEAGYTYARAFAATEQLLGLHPADRPTAIFAASDSMAIGVINALTRARVRVPEAVSVVGVNDDLHAQLTEPPLTTVRLPTDTAGHRAARLILDTLRDGPISDTPTTETLPVELVVRASTCRHTCPGAGALPARPVQIAAEGASARR